MAVARQLYLPTVPTLIIPRHHRASEKSTSATAMSDQRQNVSNEEMGILDVNKNSKIRC
jgi:hypothetical protein